MDDEIQARPPGPNKGELLTTAACLPKSAREAENTFRLADAQPSREDHPLLVLFANFITGGIISFVYAGFTIPNGTPEWLIGWHLMGNAVFGAVIGFLVGVLLLLFMKLDVEESSFRERLIATSVVVGLFIAACFSPALRTETEGISYGYVADRLGLQMLLIGWGLSFDAGRWVPWLANPALLLGLVAMSKKRDGLALGSSVVAVFLACALLVLYIEPSDEAHETPLIGYFFWLGSMVALLIGMVWIKIVSRQQGARAS